MMEAGKFYAFSYSPSWKRWNRKWARLPQCIAVVYACDQHYAYCYNLASMLVSSPHMLASHIATISRWASPTIGLTTEAIVNIDRVLAKCACRLPWKSISKIRELTLDEMWEELK